MGKPWVKLYESWWTSPSHILIPTIHLGIGARLLSLANARPYLDGIGVLVHGDGSPMSTEDMAQACRIDKPLMSEVIRNFLKAGTVVRYPNGMLGLPNMERWQESPSASRMRRMRGKKSAHVIPDKPRDNHRNSDNIPASPETHPDPRQLDIESVLAKGNLKHSKENESCLPAKPRHNGAQSDATMTPEVTAKCVQEDRREKREKKKEKEKDLKVLKTLPPIPAVTVTHEAKSGVDAIARIIDHWWDRYTSLCQRARVKPSLTSDAAKAVRARLKEGWSEASLTDAIDGAFVTPWNLGLAPESNGQRHLALTLILRSHANVERFISNLETFSKPRPHVQGPPPVYTPAKGRPKGSEALEQWNQVQDAVLTVRH